MILVAGLLAYANSLGGAFMADDDGGLVNNAHIRDLSNLAGVFFPERESPLAGRPLVSLSFALNYAVNGLNVRGYHIANITIHLGCALLVYGLLRRTFTSRALAPVFAKDSTLLAFAVALLWTVHPLNTEAVDYLTQRTESLMAVCYLGTCYASIRAAERHRRRWQAVAVAACACGMACKESMVTVPALVILYDRVFEFSSWRDAWRTRAPFYGSLMATWVILFALMRSGPRIHSAGFSTGVTVWSYLLNQSVMVVRYLHLTFWPRALVLVYGPPVPLSWRDVLPHALVVLALLLLTLVALKRWPSVGFAGAWFFVVLAPTSSIVPIATEVGAERRMYLPLVAVIALVVSCAYLLWPPLQRRLVGIATWTNGQGVFVGATAVLLVAIPFGAQVGARNREYDSRLLMARTVLARWPTGAAHTLVGWELARLGRHDEAVGEYRRAIETFPRARFSLGSELFDQGQFPEAIVQLRAFTLAEPDRLEVVGAHLILGRIFTAEHQWSPAIQEFQHVLDMTPSNVDAQVLFGDALVGAGAIDEAIAHYRRYTTARPADLGGLTSLGLALIDTNRIPEAVDVFREGVAVAPNDGRTHANLARTFLLEDDVRDASPEAELAARLESSAANCDLFGRILALQGRLNEARHEFQLALQAAPADLQAREDARQLETLLQHTKAP